jgi:hypothetical protein
MTDIPDRQLRATNRLVQCSEEHLHSIKLVGGHEQRRRLDFDWLLLTQ